MHISGSKRHFKTVRGGLVEAFKEVPVGVERRLDRSVTKPLLDDFRVLPLGDKEGGVRVAQIVKGARLATRAIHGQTNDVTFVSQPPHPKGTHSLSYSSRTTDSDRGRIPHFAHRTLSKTRSCNKLRPVYRGGEVMSLDRGTLAKIDRRVLSELDHRRGVQLVKVPLSEAVRSTWRRYCQAIGVTMEPASQV